VYFYVQNQCSVLDVTTFRADNVKLLDVSCKKQIF